MNKEASLISNGLSLNLKTWSALKQVPCHRSDEIICNTWIWIFVGHGLGRFTLATQGKDITQLIKALKQALDHSV